ncbi:phage protein Gp27 family protein [Azospirillum sp. A39]|uniref:phage protein Gp27 family protein n=1 Tax=Azospirillum sp. A39 TaxID=3462279 RepID=UPI004045376E
MAPRSGFDRLPKAIQELIGRLLDQGATIDTIRDKLLELDIDVPRSTLGDWTKRVSAIGERIRRSRAVAEVIVERFGQGDEPKVARGNIELLHAMILELQGAMTDGDTPDAETVLQLALALKSLAQASKADMDVVLAARKEVERQLEEAKKRAAAEAASKARERGMGEDDAAFIRAEILGIRLPQGVHG